MMITLPGCIARTQRRLLRNQLVTISAAGGSAGVGLLGVVLFLGTDMIPWRSLGLWGLLTLAAAVLHEFLRRPSAYRTARLLDTRLQLVDTLSTAVYFSSRPQASGREEETRLTQLEQATKVAARADIRAAFPLRIPSAIRLSLTAFALLAAVLTLVRYRAEGRLDLRHGMRIPVPGWALEAKKELESLKERLKELAQTRKEENHRDSADTRRDKSSADAPATARPDENGSESSANDSAENGANGAKNDGKKPMEQAGADAQRASGVPPPDGGDSGTQQQREERNGNEASPETAAQAGASSSLMAKLGDTLANLASALKTKSHNSADRDASPDGSANRTSQGERASSSSSKSQSAASPGNSGADGNKPEQGTGADGMNSSDANAKERAGSGAGHNEGNKEIEADRQLEAMGKISIILGKRSNDLTGTATVEVTSGHSELKTAYEKREASHREVAAVAERDRIPLEFESYVQQYFKELHRTDPKARKKK
jgi:hypothetical protein